MEQARYWMWAKRKPDFIPHDNILTSSAAMNSYVGDSWEEQAFAEDAAGTLGGCVWPPRSYSCSFCKREFRSAQALGGHMNVHRRDRARLKQSPIPPNEVVPQNHALGTCASFDAAPYSSSHQNISTFFYNNNPNPDFSPVAFSHVIRVSSPPPPPPKKVINGDSEKNNVSTLSFFSQKNDKDNIVSSHNPLSWSSFVAEKRDRVLDSIKTNIEAKKSTVVVEPDHQSRAEKEDCVTEDLETTLNLVVCRRRMNTDDEEVGSCKRRRIEVKPLSFLQKLNGVDRCVPQSEVVLKNRSGSSTDELDLELRLGDAPKVK